LGSGRRWEHLALIAGVAMLPEVCYGIIGFAGIAMYLAVGGLRPEALRISGPPIVTFAAATGALSCLIGSLLMIRSKKTKTGLALASLGTIFHFMFMVGLRFLAHGVTGRLGVTSAMIFYGLIGTASLLAVVQIRRRSLGVF